MNGTDLLGEFRAKRSEAAFSELVRRYTNLVYSVALRRLTNVSLAQEVTQLVFIRLAKAAPNLSSDAQLLTWLHRTAVHVSVDLWRAETRRRAREEHAVAMQTEPAEDIAWAEMGPFLDEALNELTDAERQAILLRFFEHKSMRDVGAVFGVSEDAAKMRVSRALERLRTQLGARGATCSAVILASLLAERAVEAAPIAFAATLASFSFLTSAGVGTGGVVASLLQISRMKLAVAAAAVIGIATFLFVHSHNDTPIAPALSPLKGEGEAPASSVAQNAVGVADANVAETNREPDPLKLLQRIASARQRITSGSMEFHVVMDGFETGRKETSRSQLRVLFDGPKHRIESFERQYRYTTSGPKAREESEAKIRAQGLDHEGAVRAGLVQPFEAHSVATYDGANMLTYHETDGRPNGTTISDPEDRSVNFVFDPRCLGLRISVSSGETIDDCLQYAQATNIALVGKEMVEGDDAWHVRVRRQLGDSFDFWIDAAQPDRLVKHAYGKDVAVSKYGGSDPIPIEVKEMHYHKGSPQFFTQFVRSNANFNIRIDPASWTLAGLGMKVGTDVSDNRIMRRIGYWTGIGLSENLPSGKSPPQTAPDLAELMSSLDNEPASEQGLQSAAWILLNTPDGPDVQRAAEVVLQYHIQNPNLAHLANEMERVRPRSAKSLLESLIEKNPNREVQATACFTLATLLKDEAEYGKNKKATAEAEKLFQRVVTEFGGSGKAGAQFARRAKGELTELRHVNIGKTAPDFTGKDFDGQTISLHDFRGKILVLIFWSVSVAEVGEEHQELVQRMSGKPVAFLGINCDKERERAKSTAEKRGMPWPTIWDGRDGPISTAWNANWWPNIFVLDRRGVIRYRDVREGKLEEAVEALLRE